MAEEKNGEAAAENKKDEDAANERKKDVVRTGNVCPTGTCPLSTPVGFVFYTLAILSLLFLKRPWNNLGFLFFALSFLGGYVNTMLRSRKVKP